MSESKLTPKQLLFIKEYLIDHNAARAARAAGYSKKTADRMGSENLSKPVIQKEIQKQMKKRHARLDISADRLMAEYAKLAFVDAKEFYNSDGTLTPIHELSDEASACVAAMNVQEIQGEDAADLRLKKIKLWDKLKAMDAIGKTLGIFEADNKQKSSTIVISRKSRDESSS